MYISNMKTLVLFLLFQFLILIAVSQPVKKLIDVDNTSGNIGNNQVRRCRRTLRPPSPPCRINQYFDEEEGRCLGIAGGGKALFIDNTRSCGTNVLKPHCTNPRYYYVCKRKKMILVQCTQGHHFDNRLQKCVHVGDRTLVSNTVQPNIEMPDSIQVPVCQGAGSFSIPGDCTLFYTCESTGHRLLQNIFRCPKGMVFDEETEMCIPSSTCIQRNSNLSLPLCTPDAGRNVTVLPDRDETGKIQESMNSDDYSESFKSEGKKKSTICETMFTDGYPEDIAVTTNNYESTEAMYDEEKLSTTTLSYTEALEHQTPQEFMVFTDNSDVTTSTEGSSETSRSSPVIASTTSVTYSTMIEDDVEGLKEISLSTAMGTTESSLETSTSMELTSSERYESITAEIEASSTTEGTSSTEMGISEPSFETSTLEEFTSSEQYDPFVAETEIPSTTEERSFIQTGTSEPSFETSTLQEFTSSERYDPSVADTKIPSTTEESSFTQTGASEPSFETSTLQEFTSSERYDPSVADTKIPSTTEESSFTQTGASEPSFETSTLEEFTSSEQYDPSVADTKIPSTTEESSFTQTGASEPSFETSTLQEFTSSKQYDPFVGGIQISSTTEGTLSTQTGSTVPSLETSTLMEFTSSEQYDPFVGEIQIPSTTEGTLSTEMGISEPSFETSTLEEFTSSEQYDPSVADTKIPSTTEESSFTQTGASEPSFETSTLQEFTSSEQYDPFVGEIQIPSTTEGTLSTQTGSTVPSLETSSLMEFTSSEQYHPFGAERELPSTTEGTSSTQTGTSEPFETSTPEEFTSSEQYKPIGADKEVLNMTEEETTEQLTTETEITEFTPTMSSLNLFSSTHSNSNNEDMTTELNILLNDAFLFVEELPGTTEEVIENDVQTTSQMSVSTENTFALNDVVTTDANIPTSTADELSLWTDNTTPEDNTEATDETFIPTESTPTSNKIATTETSVEGTSQTSTPRTDELLDTVEETTTTSMESSTESVLTDEFLELGYPENTSPDFAISTSTEAATSFSTVSVEHLNNELGKFAKILSNIEEVIDNSTSIPDIASSSESALLMDDISSDTPPADVEVFNKTVGQLVQLMNDMTLALNTALPSKTAVLKDDVSSSTATLDIEALNETVGAIRELINNFSSILNSIPLLESAKYDKENMTLPMVDINSATSDYSTMKKEGRTDNIDVDDKNIATNGCATFTASPLEGTTETDTLVTRELSGKTDCEAQDSLNTAIISKTKSNEIAETAIPSSSAKPELYSNCPNVEMNVINAQPHSPVTNKQQETLSKQNENAAKVTQPMRTISSHIVLPLTSSVLNITDKFERRLREILRNFSKIRS